MTISETTTSRASSVHSLRVVRLRVNAAGSRRIGEIRLRSQQNRASDLLNEAVDFMTLHNEVSSEGANSESLLRKSSVSYIEIVNEPLKVSKVVPDGAFRLVAVHLAKPEIVLDGELFVPRGFAPEAVLNDNRPFLNLRKVAIRDSNEAYSYLAV